MTGSYEYKTGGSLGEAAPSYVVRQADDEFYRWLKAGEFCYIFNSRQMGKTSLLVRAMKRLEAEGYACITIDATEQGSQEVDIEMWYGGIAYTLVTRLKVLDIREFDAWWDERMKISPVQRLGSFIEEILLPKFTKNIIISIDEIDTFINLNFPTDDFFALIRSFYEKRNLNPDFHRLTFALVGVATPSDLIQDERRTPFNIGKAIELTGFKLEETHPLAQGLATKTNNPMVVMEAILSWTGGQPFLTQKVCSLIFNADFAIPNYEVTRWVEELIQANIIYNWEAQDEPEHLKTIRNWILGGEQVAGRWLGWYQQILQNGDIAIDDMKFRLTGLVVKQQGRWKVYNQIYAHVFNLNWVEKELSKLRPYAESFNAWKSSNFQDNSQLLRGKELENVSKWATDKSLSDEDYRFLSTSQNYELKQVQQKTQRQIRLGSGFLVVVAIVAGTLAIIANKQRLEAQEGINLEKTGSAALRQFDSEPLKALVTAMETAQKLKEIVKDNRPLEKYPATSPIVTLQTMLDDIHESNQLEGHEGEVYSATFSPNGQRIISASADHTVKVWNSQGKWLFDLKGHQGKVYRASFSPDGQRIVTASEDKTAKVWNSQGQWLFDLKGHQGQVYAASFSPDGQRIVTASEDRTAKVWNSQGQWLFDLKGHQGQVYSANFSRDGQRIVTASEDRTAKVWNSQGQLLFDLKEHQAPIYSASFSPNGQRIVTASEDNEVNIWEIKNNSLNPHPDPLFIKPLSNYNVMNANFSPDGRRIVVTFNNGNAEIYPLLDIEHPDDFIGNFKSFSSPLNILKGHQKAVNYASYSPDGQRMVTASSDKSVRVWNIKEKNNIYLKNKNISSLAFGRVDRIVVGFKDGKAQILDVKGNLVAELKGHQKDVNKTVLSDDGQYALTISRDAVKLWDMKGNLLADIKENIKDVTNGTVSDKGKYIITTIPDQGIIKIWDSKGNLLADFKGHEKNINNFKFSPDEKHIITVSDDHIAKVWDIKGKLLTELKGHQDAVTSAIFSPDGQRIVTTSRDQTAKIWDMKGKLLADLKGYQDIVTLAEFSSDGQHIVTTSNERIAKIWDIKGNLVADLKGHQDIVTRASFSPDGQRIVTTSADLTAKLWDLNGILLADFKEYHKSNVAGARFIDDGQRIVTVSVERGFDGDQRVSIGTFFVGDLDNLLTRGCNWLQDYLSTHPEVRERLKVCK
ncbi:WD-40 repeat protein [Calothrix sp. NIES-2100]|uniref:AAA-like domain-containing protein n=1 Tax=Calothrix sp. NIES-2100 TaxID=1954172 RepID=UPI000B5FA9AA|nr:WD-40 repeat protein [Calothrix sp. NIES-2100]